jgi:hypothetical protein
MWDDPIIAETRHLREQVASRFKYDVLALGEYFKTKRAKDAKKQIVKAVKLMKQAQLKPHEQFLFAPKLQQPVAVSAAAEHPLVPTGG